MSYRPKAEMSYSVRRPKAFKPMLKAKAISARAQSVAVPKVSSSTVANVIDVANFLSRYISGEQNIVLAPGLYSGFSASKMQTPQGRTYFKINVPSWEKFEIGVKGFDRYRIYRYGVFHEACHVRYTPPILYAVSDPVVHDLVNIIEDRRIEENGVKEWPGYLPERIYATAYGYALRPPVDQIGDRDQRLTEAFMQKYLTGKIKGKLDPSERKLVDEAVKIAEEVLKEFEGVTERGGYGMGARIIRAAEEIKRLLNLQNPMQKKTNSHSPWEDTFTPDYYRTGTTLSEDNVQKAVEEFVKELKREAKKCKDEKKSPLEITEEDVEKSLEGTAEVKDEYERIQKEEKVDPDLVQWSRAATQGPLIGYKDERFIQAMNTYLQAWREGYLRIVGKTGTTFSVKEYIKHKDEPFVTKLKQTVKRKKILILADFSGSMHDNEDAYKKAIISSLVVLDGIGCNIGFFTFASDPALGNGYYRIKTFEEPKLTKTHLAKIAGLEARYPCTPTATAYSGLLSYTVKHKPDVFITITDGDPDNVQRTYEMVRTLKRHTRMVAYGIANDQGTREKMEKDLKDFGYHKSFAVTDVREIPPKLVQLIIS
ncbi:MAG: vWA domain-containing protein [Nitrososphaerota archaeon]